jgi:hypothetical protein
MPMLGLATFGPIRWRNAQNQNAAVVRLAAFFYGIFFLQSVAE